MNIAIVVSFVVCCIVLVICLFKIAYLNRSIKQTKNLENQWQNMVDQLNTDQAIWTNKLKELRVKESSLYIR